MGHDVAVSLPVERKVPLNRYEIISSTMRQTSHQGDAFLYKLVGYWCSDVILCYFHVQLCHIISVLSKLRHADGQAQL